MSLDTSKGVITSNTSNSGKLISLNGLSKLNIQNTIMPNILELQADEKTLKIFGFEFKES